MNMYLYISMYFVHLSMYRMYVYLCMDISTYINIHTAKAPPPKCERRGPVEFPAFPCHVCFFCEKACVSSQIRVYIIHTY